MKKPKKDTIIHFNEYPNINRELLQAVHCTERESKITGIVCTMLDRGEVFGV